MAAAEARYAAALAEVALRRLAAPLVEREAPVARQQPECGRLHERGDTADLCADAAVARAAARCVDLHLEAHGAAMTAAAMLARLFGIGGHETSPALAWKARLARI